MKKLSTRILALLLTLAMVFSYVPGVAQTAHAVEEETTPVVETTPEETVEPVPEKEEVIEPSEEEVPSEDEGEPSEEELPAPQEEDEDPVASIEEENITTWNLNVPGLEATCSGLEVTSTTTGYSAPVLNASAEDNAISVVITANTNKNQSGRTVLTLTNTNDDEARLSFNWETQKVKNSAKIILAYEEGITAIGADDFKTMTSVRNGQLEFVMPAGTSVTFTLESTKYSSDKYENLTLKLTNIDIYVDADVQTTYKAVDAAKGSYTVDGNAITTDTVITKKAQTGYVLEAAPAEGYAFQGWYNETTGTYISYSQKASVQIKEAATVYPAFIAVADALWAVGDANFADYADAVACAQSGSVKEIALLKDYTLTEDLTVPADVVLLIPFDQENTCYTTDPESTPGLDPENDGTLNSPTPWEVPYAYRTLTLAENVTLTVKGGLSVSAQHSPGAQKTAGSPSGPCGFIKTSGGSKIDVLSGGGLYAWGYVVGSGSVTINSGAAVYENLQLTDFRGGSASGNIALNKDLGVFPFSQYYVQNVEIPMTIYSGAKEAVFVSIWASNSINSLPINFIGTSDAMFRMGSGARVVKSYDSTRDRLVVDTYGDVSLYAMSATAPMVGSVATSDFDLPITNNISINVKSGKTSINQSVALLPGVEVNVAKNAELEVAESYYALDEEGTVIEADERTGWNVYVYDTAEWVGGGYVYTSTGNKDLSPVAWSYANGTKAVRTSSTLQDAKIDINGTAYVSGYLYTTESGANICSSGGTGKVILWSGTGPETETYQVQQSSSGVTYDPIVITGGQLKNSDGTYTDTSEVKTETSEAYYYNAKTGTWDTVSYVTYLDRDGNEIQDWSEKHSNIDIEYTLAEDEVYTVTLYGYEDEAFLGWDADGDGDVDYNTDEEIPFTGSLTLKAVWNVIEYTITWNVNGTETTVKVEDGKTPAYEGTPVKAADGCTTYTFAGWATSADGAVLESIPAATGDATYYAIFTSTTNHSFTTKPGKVKNPGTCQAEAVHYVQCDKCEAQSDTLTVKGAKDKNNHATPDQFTYVNNGTTHTKKYACCGADIETVGHTYVDGHCVCKAIASFTVTWVADGKTIETETVEYGKNATKTPAVPAKEGHTGAWDKTATNVKSDVTITAVYTINKYTVTWVADGKTVETETVEYGKNATKTPAVPAKEGHTGAWDKTATNVKSDVTITAVYTINKYTVTWVANGETFATETVEYGKDAANTPAVPAKEGYTGAWDKTATNVKSDLTINAVYTVNAYNYKIERYEMNLSGYYELKSTETKTADYGTEIDLTGITVPTGFHLDGENADSKLKATVPANNTLVMKVFLARNTVVINVNWNGELLQKLYNYYGATVQIPTGTTPEGHTFLGYAKSEGGEVFIPAADLSKAYTMTESMDLYAVFEANTYTVTFTINGEAYGDPVEVKYGAAITAPDYKAPTGYTFSGWTLPETMPAEDITLDATVEVNMYTLEIEAMDFDGEGHGYSTINVDVPYGAKLADYIPDDVYKPGDTVSVNGNKFKGTWTITGWDSWSEEDGYQAIDIATATMPVDGITIAQSFAFTGWEFYDEGTMYCVGNDYYYDTIAHIDGEAYLFDENGYIVAGAGLVRFETEDGTIEYYYFCDGYCEDSDEACKFREPSYTAFKEGVHWVYNDNDLLPNWDYTFDDRGVILHHQDTSLNGLHDQGEDTIYYIDGVPAYMGLIEIDGDLYYVRSTGKLVKNRTYWISKTNGLMKEAAYTFDADGKLFIDTTPKKNGIIAENGGLYYYVEGKLTYAGLIEIDGELYYVRTSGQLVQSQKYWITKTNGLLKEGAYHFDAEGKLYTPDPVIEILDGYYYVDGVLTYAGLIEIDGYYYYVRTNGQIVKNQRYWITKTNGLKPEGSYEFDAEGRLIEPAPKFNGIKDGYYYVNGVKTYAGLIEIDGELYYINSSCQVITGRKYWITKTNGLLPEGSYTFDATGKLVG